MQHRSPSGDALLAGPNVRTLFDSVWRAGNTATHEHQGTPGSAVLAAEGFGRVTAP